MPWYTLQVRTGFESKVVREIERKIQEGKISGVKEIFAPEETIISTRNGKPYERKAKVFANYVWIDMDYTEKNWHEFHSISGANNFIGDKSRPAVTPDYEIELIKSRLTNVAPRPSIVYDVGQKIRIKDGAFQEYIGTIVSVDYSKNKANVEVVIFGRATPVETGIDTLEKVEG